MVVEFKGMPIKLELDPGFFVKSYTNPRLARQLTYYQTRGNKEMTTESINYPIFHNGLSAAGTDVAVPTIENVASATDLELTRAAAVGDMVAFEEIYQRHHRRV